MTFKTSDSSDGSYSSVQRTCFNKKYFFTTFFFNKNLHQQKIESAIFSQHLILNPYRVFDPSCHPQISLILLATPKFPYVPETRKKVLNWLPSEITKLRTYHPPKMAESPIPVSLGWQVLDFAFFWGWQVLALVISEDGQFMTFWILAHREIWRWQEGSNTLYKN